MITNRRDYGLWKPQYERIREDFCPTCKYRKTDQYGCSHFLYGDGICLQFKWRTQTEKKQFEEQVLDSQAETIWLERNKTLQEIHKMTKTQLRSVLTKKHFEQFTKEQEYTEKLLAQILQEESEARQQAQQPPEIKQPPKQEKARTKITQKPVAAPPVKPPKPTQTRQPVKQQPPEQTTPKTKQPPFANQGLLKRRTTMSVSADVVQKITERVSKAKIIVVHEPAMTKEQAIPLPDATHYFYCEKQGKKVTYKRSTQIKNYVQEVTNFRKYLAKQGIKIIKEEIKQND